MGTFYDEWLSYWDEEQAERARARKFIHEEDLQYIGTKQDHSAALVCSRQNGFATAGDVMLGQIPGGWNTGKHSHGEEAIFIIEGQGCSLVDDRRYDWDTGSCLFMPFGAVHQHFNTGGGTVRYLSVTALALERFAGLAKLVQHEEAGKTPAGKLDAVKRADSDIDPKSGRIVLRLKDAPVFAGSETVRRMAGKKDEFFLSMAKEMKTVGNPSHRSRSIVLMSPENDFKTREVEITHVLCDEPGKYSGKHAHMEALLYVLHGEGYSIVDGETIPWKKGTLLQVQGPQTVHQHFNTGQIEVRHLRIHYGIRSRFFQAIAKRTFPYVYHQYSQYKQ